MKYRRQWIVIGITVAVLALVSATTIVLARPPAQGPTSEEGASGSTTPQELLRQIIGDDPDEDGYSGPIPAGDGSDVAPSEEGAGRLSSGGSAASAPQPDEDGYQGPVQPDGPAIAESSENGAGPAPDWDQFFLEPQPDQDAYYASGRGLSNSLSYLHVAGAALRPRDSDTNWTYGGGGCVYASLDTATFNINMQIPDNSQLEYLRLYYYDASGQNGIGYLTSYDGEGGFTDLATVVSTGSSGYGTGLSGFISHTVDYENNAYVLNWRPEQAGDTMRLCGLRVAYRLPN